MDFNPDKTVNDIFKNEQLLDILIRFEEYLDVVGNCYVYENVHLGEIVHGPVVNRYDVEVVLKYDIENTPDPRAWLALTKHGTLVSTKRDIEEVPIRKLETPNDYRDDAQHPMKPKLVPQEVLLVKIIVPRRFIDDRDTKEYQYARADNISDSLAQIDDPNMEI